MASASGNFRHPVAPLRQPGSPSLTSVAPSTPSAGRPPTALHAIAAIVERLAAGDPLDSGIPAVLRTLQSALNAREVAVWLTTPNGLERAWAVGEPQTTATWLKAALEQPDAPRDNLKMARLSTGGRRLGLLAVVPCGRSARTKSFL